MRSCLSVLLVILGANCFAQEPVYDDRPLSAWLDQLKGSELASRRAAAALLAQRLTAEVRDAAAPLAMALKNDDRRMRVDIAKAIKRLATPAQTAAVNRLVDDLNNKSQRNEAIRALGDLGVVARAAGSNVLAAMQAADKDKVLQVIGARTVMELDNRSARTMVPVLVNGLRDSGRDVRRHAAEGLGELGGQVAGRAAQPLVEALKDSDQEVRVSAAWALARVENREISKALACLVDIIGSAESERIRNRTIESLGDLGMAARSALEPLRNMLKHSDVASRLGAAVAMHGIDSKGTIVELIPVFVAGLKDDNANVRKITVEAVKQLGPERSTVITASVADLRTSGHNYFKNSEMVETIAQLGELTVPGFIGLVNDPKTDTRLARAVIECLGNMGRPAKNAVPALVGALQDRQRILLHRHAIAALGKIGTVALPEVKLLLKHHDVRVRVLAVHVLGAMGADAKPMLSELKTLAKDDVVVRSAAESAIRRIQSIP